MLRTRITEEYSLEVPVISAGIAFVAGPQRVAAVPAKFSGPWPE
jgi:hypothetical protein